MTWKSAACARPEVDPEIFFPSMRGNEAHRALQVREAQAMCDTCPLVQACLSYAQKLVADGIDLHGVWGGWTETDRRQGFRADRPKLYGQGKAFDTGYCGTHSGYTRHNKWGVPACDPCRAAEKAYSRQQREKRKARRDAEADARLGIVA